MTRNVFAPKYICVNMTFFFFFKKESMGRFKGMFKKNTKLLEARTQSEVRTIFYCGLCH